MDVTFPTPFTSIPRVATTIMNLDIGDINKCAILDVQTITTTKFTIGITINPHCATVRVTYNWLATIDPRI